MTVYAYPWGKSWEVIIYFFYDATETDRIVSFSRLAYFFFSITVSPGTIESGISQDTIPETANSLPQRYPVLGNGLLCIWMLKFLNAVPTGIQVSTFYNLYYSLLTLDIDQDHRLSLCASRCWTRLLSEYEGLDRSTRRGPSANEKLHTLLNIVKSLGRL